MSFQSKSFITDQAQFSLFQPMHDMPFSICTLEKYVRKKPPIAMMYALINVSWRWCTRFTNVSKTEGVHSFCCGFLSKKIKIWQKIIFNAENNWLWTNRTILSHMAVHIRHGRLAGYLTAIHHPEITVERGSREIVSLPNSWYWNRDLEQQPIDRSKCPC